MRQRESVPVPRGWSGGAVWKGAGASLLLHLFVGAAVIVALSGPPKAAPRVIDLTLLPPSEIDRRIVPPPSTAADLPGKAVSPEPPTLFASPPVANPPDMTAPASSSDPAGERNAPSAGTGPSRAISPYSPSSTIGASPGSPPGAAAPAQAATDEGGGKTAAGNPAGKTDPGPPALDFAWVRDAIQHAIAYPATARRMGWEGKVVVAFHLLSDGSVRDVRVVQGSGHAALDRGAIDAVRNASPFPRSPVEAEVITPVVYRLTSVDPKQ